MIVRYCHILQEIAKYSPKWTGIAIKLLINTYIQYLEEKQPHQNVKSGKFYYRMHWETGSNWIKQGNVVMNDSRNLLYHFANIPKNGTIVNIMQ